MMVEARHAERLGARQRHQPLRAARGDAVADSIFRLDGELAHIARGHANQAVVAVRLVRDAVGRVGARIQEGQGEGAAVDRCAAERHSNALAVLAPRHVRYGPRAIAHGNDLQGRGGVAGLVQQGDGEPGAVGEGVGAQVAKAVARLDAEGRLLVRVHLEPVGAHGLAVGAGDGPGVDIDAVLALVNLGVKELHAQGPGPGDGLPDGEGVGAVAIVHRVVVTGEAVGREEDGKVRCIAALGQGLVITVV
mmetsp:Transcript_26701/g.67100  ORF Transcript_26701/g.67100 Transcript_26701/m.67100 type:complete len:249 (+) Transcript_26701:828-1574(+)